MRTRNVDRFKARDYLKRAEECWNAARRSFEEGEWNACVINAVHSVIAAADAFCIAKTGLRHAGERHADAVALFLSASPHDEEVKKAAGRLSRILDVKTDAEYGESLLSKRDAEEATYAAEKILELVRKTVK